MGAGTRGGGGGRDAAGLAIVRCPAERCGQRFAVPVDRLGRNVYCLTCGVRMTARPAGVEDALAERAERTPRGGEAPIERLPLRAVVDNVRSLWNVGSIFRSADGCGIEHLYLTGITGHPPRAEIRKTALGAEEIVAWSWHERPEDAVQAARADGFRIVALEPGGVPLDRFEAGPRTCLVVGNEVAGISPGLAAHVDASVAIPMSGVKTSFNVAVAFGIAGYVLARHVVRSKLERGER